MGLDVSVEGGHSFRAGSYSGFHEFRKRLAKDSMGLELEDMRGFGRGSGSKPWPRKSGMEVLLHHSDCDGYISWSRADRLLIALRIYRAQHRNEKDDAFSSYWWSVDNWIRICEDSARLRKSILFH